MRIFSLGFDCNNACVFCAQGALRAREGNPEPVRVEELEAIAPGEIVAFVGGEPTLSDRLPELIRAADALGAQRVVLQTNGRRLAYRTYARELAAASRRLVIDLALHGSTEAMHEYHTAAPGSFKQSAQGIRNACSEGLAVGVTTVITRSNYRHLGDIAQLSRALGANAIHFAIAEPLGSAAASRDRVVPPIELVRPYLARAVADARRIGMGVLVAESAEPPEVRLRFAGIGAVEEPIASAPAGTDDGPRRVLRVLP